MNKKIVFFLVFAFATIALAQDDEIELFSKDFSDGTISPLVPEGNWQIDNNYGNPTPAAKYNYYPSHYNYSHSLTSPDLDGSTVNDSVAFSYDLYLNNYSTSTLEQLSVEIRVDTSWITLATYDNINDDITWGSHTHYVSEYFPTNNNVQIRFRAFGEYSYNLNYWVIDNIKLNGKQDTTPPTPPAGLSASPEDNQVVLSWSSNSEDDLSHYKIYKGDSSPAATLIDSVASNSDGDTSYVDLNVFNGEVYYYRITAVDLAGNESEFSSEVSITPYDPAVGSAVELLSGNSLSNISGNSAGYPINTWYHDHLHQSLYLASELASAGIAPGTSINGIQLWIYQQPGRNLDSLRIAVAQTANTTLSVFETVTIVHGPTNYLQSDFTAGEWHQFVFDTPLVWDGNSNIVIEYSHDNTSYVSGGGIYLRSSGSNKSVRGYSDSGYGHYPFNGMYPAPDNKVAAIKLLLQEAAVQAPTNLAATPGYQRVDLSWTASASSGIAQYMIYRGTSSGDVSLIDSTSSTTYSDLSLTNGTTYYYGIRSINSDGETSANSLLTGATPSVETPLNLSGVPGSQQVTLSWSAPTGDGVARALVYQYGEDGGGITLVDSTNSSNDSTITITDLTNGDQYYFRLSYRGEDNTIGSYSNIIGVMPDYTGPSWYVSTSGSDAGDGSATAPFSKIQQAIDEASENDTIKIRPGTYTGYGNYDINPGKDLVILGVGGADSVTIDVAGNIADRKSGFKLESYSYSSMQIKGLTIINALSSTGSGGAIILSNAGSVTIEDCVIGPGNKAALGAGIYVLNTSATIKKTVIKGNSINMTSGIYDGNVHGVGLYINNTTPSTSTIENSIIRGNGATASGNQNDMYGGGFYVTGNSTTNFINSFIYNNDLSRSGNQGWWSRGGGGAVTNGATVYFVHTDILNNKAENTTSASDGRGGALWLDGNNTSVFFLNSIVWGNVASTSDATEQMLAVENGSYYSFNYSNLQVVVDDPDFEENLFEDPEFNDPENNDFSLSLRSGLLGAGATTAMTSIAGASLITDTDFSGSARPGSGGGNPDIGALESSLAVSPVPNAPTGLTATAADGQVDLSWTASSDADVSKYGIYYGTETGPSVKRAEVSGATSVSVTGLQNNTTYYFRVTAIDADEYESSFSDEVTGVPTFAGETIYVDGSSSQSQETGSATYPFHTIQDAINAEATTNGKRILVLAGTYTYEASDVTFSFSFNDSYGNQTGSFTVSGSSILDLNFSHSNTNSFPGSTWTISSNSYFNSINNFSISATSESNTSFNFSTSSSPTLTGPTGAYMYGTSVNVWQSSSFSQAVLDLVGKNIVLEAVSGPDSTFIDGEGDYSALDMNAQVDDYDGYSSATEFIGFTFKDGPDDGSLIHIIGPEISSDLDWAPTFTNCRFIDTEMSVDVPEHAPIVVYNAEPVFEGCEFRNLNLEANSSYFDGDIYGPIRLYGTSSFSGGSYDTTAYRPQFKNCVIAGNSLKRSTNYYSGNLNLNGGAVSVGFGMIPYFENTRIDSNLVDIQSGRNGQRDAGFGGGIYLSHYLFRGERIRFVNCSISANSVIADDIYGGGIYVQYPSVSFINTVITNNELDGQHADNNDWGNAQGAGIHYNVSYSWNTNNEEDPDIRIVNSTIADNSIKNIAENFNNVGGAGINRNDVDGHSTIIFNSIVYNNEIEGYLESQNYRMNLSAYNNAYGDEDADIDYSIIEYFTETGLEEDDLVDTDPGFVGSGDYSLAASSVAIGRGTDEYENIDAPAFDYNSSIRPNPDGSDPDLGAFENSLSSTPYPNKPQSLSVASERDSSIVLSWTANSEDDLAKYRIYYGTSSATTLLDSVSGTPSYTAEGLNNYTTYYFAVSAVDLDGYESGKSNEVSGEPKWIGPNWYVDTDNGSSSGDGSPANPFREIQDAIDAVDPLSRNDGLKDTVLVLPGTYDRSGDQNLYFKYTEGNYDGNPKNLVLKSRDGAATTILDGEGGKRLFQITDGTDTTLQIIGFTITNGGEDDGSGNAVKIQGQNYWDHDQGVQVTYPSGVTFRKCIFTANGTAESTEEPPVIYLYQGFAVLEDCEITENILSLNSSSSAQGGAIYMNDNSGVTLVRTKILDNQLTSSSTNAKGAGIYSTWSDNQLLVLNSVIARNTTSAGGFGWSQGAGICWYGGTIDIVNSTIVDNVCESNNSSSQGAALYLSGSQNVDGTMLTMFNSIVYGNTPIDDQLYIDPNNDNFDIDHYISYSLLQGTDINNYEDGIFEANPEFADSTYVLHERSPAIGAGSDESENTEGDEIYPPTVDILGNARPIPDGSNPDLGAYEHELAVTPYPALVENLTAEPQHMSVELEWDYHDEQDVLMYIAYMAEDSINFSAVDTVEGRFSTRTTIGGLVNGTDYWFYLTAVDSADYESSPTLHAVTSPFFQGPVWIVDDGGGSSNGEGSPEDPMKYIRDAIEESADGDTVMILPGQYDHAKNRNLDFQYNNNVAQNGIKNLTLIGSGGADTTVIDLDGNDFIDFENGESDSRIEGLTITNSSSGAVRVSNSSVSIKNCVFQDNSNTNQNGGAVLVENSNQPVQIENTKFDNNSSNFRGGAVALWSDGGEVFIANCIFINNNANEVSGAVHKDQNTNLMIINSLFQDNTTQSTFGAAGISIMQDLGYAEIINSVFINNTLSNGLDGDVDGPAYVDHTILQSETSPVFSSGDNYVFPDISTTYDTEFSPSIGSGMNDFFSEILDDDVIVSDYMETDYYGNARIQPAGSKIDIGPIEHERWEQRRKVFYLATDGDDSNDGLTDDSPLLTLAEAFSKSVIRDTIELSAGTYSGADNRDLLFNGVDRIIRSTSGAESTIIDCENMGPAFVINDEETDSTIISGITIQNGLSEYGGAVNISGTDPVFDGVIFRYNHATVSGGAVYANDSDAEFVNCVFNWNSGAESTVLYAENSDIGMDFITATGNGGDGEVSFSGDVHISNSILWGNSPVDADVTIAYSDIMGGSDGEGNYNGRPGFIDGFNGNFNLQDWSPVIGQAEDSTGVGFDIDGNARPENSPDMGAYENALDTPSIYTSQQWFVSPTGTDSARVGMGTDSDPFGSIQYALNHAIYDDEVRIRPGAYDENLNNWGKDLLIVGDGVSHPNNEVAINGSFEISGGTPGLYDLHLINEESDVLQINNDAIATLYNLLVTDSDYSGVSINDDASAYMYSVTIYNNWKGIYENTSGTVSAVNSILWDNITATYGLPDIAYSNVQADSGVTYSGLGIINADPNFIVDSLDFNLQITSPCIDAGDPSEGLESDSTVIDMGAFPLIREFLEGTSDGNIVINNDEPAVITEDFTLGEGDTLTIDPGATVYFDPGVTMTVDGIMAASGDANNPISFESSNPDSGYGGVIINTESDGGRDHTPVLYEYLLIQDVGSEYIPLTISGDAELNHVTIAGNEHATSLLVIAGSGSVDLNYSILEGDTSGAIDATGSFWSEHLSTDQFVDYANGDYTLLSSADAIDADTTGDYVDPDYTFGDAGCFYHDQSAYPAGSISFLYPASGDTILVSPDSSASPVYGLGVSAQVFNTIGHYKTNTYTQWASAGPVDGSLSSEYSATSDLRGIVHQTFYTSSTAGDLNSMTVSEDGVTAQSGHFNIVPGNPDSVWVNEQTEMSMTQLDTLTITANIFDQFGNLVSDGESVTWSAIVETGAGEGFTLSESTSSTADGSVSVTLSTDPTDNSLAVGDQVEIQAVSGSGTHESALITIIPDDIYNLTMPEELTDGDLEISADVGTYSIEATLIDTFDNALEGVEVNWEVVLGSGTGESLSAASSLTNSSGTASTILNTSTVSGSEYTVHAWVTDDALLSAIMGNDRSVASTSQGHHQVRSGKKGAVGAPQPVNEIQVVSLPVRITETSSTSDDDVSRDHSVYDLDDTTAVIHVLPGVTASVSLPQDSVDVLLEDEFQVEGTVSDQFGNMVADGTPVNWEIIQSNSSIFPITITSMDDVTTDGKAAIDLRIETSAPWEFDFTIQLTSENIIGETGTFNVHDVTAPAAVSGLSINPDVWTSVNDFTLTWSNPSEHSGVAGAHYSIDGTGDTYVEGENISTMTELSLPTNQLTTFDVWLEDKAGNQDQSTSQSVTAKWDDIPPTAFNVTSPVEEWYNTVLLRFEWLESSDETAGLEYYTLDIDGGNLYQQHKDSTGINIPDGFAEGTHSWIISAYDSAGNERVTSDQTFFVDYTSPGISHNPVLEGTENSPVTVTATFTDQISGINVAELYYRRGGETIWQGPIDMTTLNTHQIASSFVTSAGLDYYIYARDAAGNETRKPESDHYSISVTIPGMGLASTDRWPTGVPNGSSVSSYQLLSFPGLAANNTPNDLLITTSQFPAYDNTLWRFYTYANNDWVEFVNIGSIDPGVGYMMIVKDPEYNVSTGQTRTVTTDEDFVIDFAAGEWVMIGNPFDFNIPLGNVLVNDSTTLSGDPNLYTYDGTNGWVPVTRLEPWKGYIYKSANENQIRIIPLENTGGLKISEPAMVLAEDEWLVDINARNGLGVDNLNTVGMITAASDEYDPMDTFEPPMVPGGISLRMDNRDWAENGDIYSSDIRTVKEDGEFWDMEVAAQDDKHNVYLKFEGIEDIPAEFDVFAIDVTLGVAQDLRWNPVYRYAVSNPEAIHDIRFIAGTRDFVKSNNAGVDLYPERFNISQNFPNPFNPQTSVLITLEDISRVDLIVYNVLGEEVVRIADRQAFPAGYHNFTWRGLNKDGKRVASGVYFYTTRITDMSGKTIMNRTNKMIMVK